MDADKIKSNQPQRAYRKSNQGERTTAAG